MKRMREPSKQRENEIMDDLTTTNDTCQKPGCTADATDTYRGENENRLRLCERHYYNLVSGKTSTPSIVADLQTGFGDGSSPAELGTSPRGVGEPLIGGLRRSRS